MDSLPEDILVEISSKIAAESVKEIHNLQIVSNTFHRTCNEQYLLCRISLNKYPIYPWFLIEDFRTPFNAFIDRCLQANNPEAVYRAGVVKFFHSGGDELKEKEGLQQLRFAAEKGNEIFLLHKSFASLGSTVKESIDRYGSPYLNTHGEGGGFMFCQTYSGWRNEIFLLH